MLLQQRLAKSNNLLAARRHVLHLLREGLELCLHVLQLPDKRLEPVGLRAHLLHTRRNLLNAVISASLLQCAPDELHGAGNHALVLGGLGGHCSPLLVGLALEAELSASEALVDAVHADQLVVCAALDNATILDHDDLVRVHDGRQPGVRECKSACGWVQFQDRNVPLRMLEVNMLEKWP
jgi:hypothetical protein